MTISITMTMIVTLTDNHLYDDLVLVDVGMQHMAKKDVGPSKLRGSTRARREAPRSRTVSEHAETTEQHCSPQKTRDECCPEGLIGSRTLAYELGEKELERNPLKRFVEQSYREKHREEK